MTESKQVRFPLDPLADVMAKLRGEHGCPWDREQTPVSLKKYLIEETYEVLEAIDSGDWYKTCEELGDLLLQIVFHAQIASEQQQFDLNEVISGITQKMIRRHPHVFGSVKVADSSEVLVNWDKIKAKEKAGQGTQAQENTEGQKPAADSVLSGIPKGLPALMAAEKLQAKAAKVGFDWPDYRGAWAKVNEELEEVGQVLADLEAGKPSRQAQPGRQNQSGLSGSGTEAAHLQEELGDLLFAIVNVARFFRIDPEEAMLSANAKFIRRFSHIEQEVGARGLRWEALTLAELDKIWDDSKELEENLANSARSRKK